MTAIKRSLAFVLVFGGLAAPHGATAAEQANLDVTETAVAGDNAQNTSATAHPVILLHGLGRSGGSMNKLGSQLLKAGYDVCNVSYPSTTKTVSELASENVKPAIEVCLEGKERKVSFVTHSLGGIIVRELYASGLLRDVHRVIMLSPPNEGSELVDRLSRYWLFDFFLGPAANELGTDADSKPNDLGPAEFELGIVMGTRSINPIGSLLIPGRDDGTVSIESSKLEGMVDYIEIPANHAFIMKHKLAIQQVIYFLENGQFDHATDVPEQFEGQVPTADAVGTSPD